jgi:hypothetical protein
MPWLEQLFNKFWQMALEQLELGELRSQEHNTSCKRVTLVGQVLVGDDVKELDIVGTVLMGKRPSKFVTDWNRTKRQTRRSIAEDMGVSPSFCCELALFSADKCVKFLKPLTWMISNVRQFHFPTRID